MGFHWDTNRQLLLELLFTAACFGVLETGQNDANQQSFDALQSNLDVIHHRPIGNFTARTPRLLRVHHVPGNGSILPYTFAIDTSSKNKTFENNHDEQEEITIGGNETLIDINFRNERDFSDLFDPQNSSSLFRFTSLRNNDIDEQLFLDHAAFTRDADAKRLGILKMVSVPFSRWLPPEFGVDAVMASYEASIEAKQKLLFDDENIIISVEMQFMCKTLNTGLHRFPQESVTDASNDPRLASCGFSLIADNDKDNASTNAGLEFGIYTTSRGIWAVYNRLAVVGAMKNISFDAFEMYKLLAWRDYPRQILVARIEIDKKARETRYFLANQLMWAITDWGRLTSRLLSKRRNRLVSFSPGSSTSPQNSSPKIDVPTSFTLYIRNMHKMDVADPNYQRKSRIGGTEDLMPTLVRLNGLDPDYYETEFYEDKSSRYKCLYGQGAVMGLKRLTVERRRSGQAGLGALTKMLITRHKKRTVVVIDEANVTAQIVTLQNKYPTGFISNLLNKTVNKH